MRNVIFVLSGFQNPLRSELRSKATAMGAVCNDDWDEKCTHLMYVEGMPSFEEKRSFHFVSVVRFRIRRNSRKFRRQDTVLL